MGWLFSLPLHSTMLTIHHIHLPLTFQPCTSSAHRIHLHMLLRKFEVESFKFSWMWRIYVFYRTQTVTLIHIRNTNICSPNNMSYWDPLFNGHFQNFWYIVSFLFFLYAVMAPGYRAHRVVIKYHYAEWKIRQ